MRIEQKPADDGKKSVNDGRVAALSVKVSVLR